MSAADVEVVREMLEAFNRGDYEGSTAMFDDRIEMHQAPEVPDSDTYVGKDEFLRGMARWLSGFERGFQYLPEELVDCDDRIFARVGLRGVGRGSGVELEDEIYHVYEVRDRKIVRLYVLWNESEARKLAGLAAE
jgi:ketosteroid isomerase-like protein